MAGTLLLNVVATVANGNYSDRFAPGQKTITVSGTPVDSGIATVGTSEEDLAVGDVASEGYLMLQNLDSTNYVEYGPKNSGSMVALGKLKAGEVAVIRMKPGATLRWIADTAACQVEYLLLSD